MSALGAVPCSGPWFIQQCQGQCATVEKALQGAQRGSGRVPMLAKTQGRSLPTANERVFQNKGDALDLSFTGWQLDGRGWTYTEDDVGLQVKEVFVPCSSGFANIMLFE